MAKKVQPIEVSLGIKGAEKISALKSSFRDLGKTIGLTDSVIEDARKDIIAYGKTATQSEALIKGQIKAFEGLREQASRGGKVYLELGDQIQELKEDLRGSTAAAEEQRIALLKTGQAAKSSSSSLKSVVDQLEKLQKGTRPGSTAFLQLAKDISALKAQLSDAGAEVKKFNAGFAISQIPGASIEKIQNQIGKLREGLKSLKFTSEDFLNVQERIALLGQVQARVTGRQQVIAAESLFSSKAFENFAQGPAGSLNLPKTAAALNLEISELQERLANTVPGSTYANITVEIANKQRELREILNGTADAYDRVAAAQDRSTRVAQKVAGIQEYQATTGGTAPGVGGFRDPETGAIIARGSGSIRDRRAFNQARADLANAIIQGAIEQSRTLALPAAGQTSAPGTGLATSGGAKRLGRSREVVRGAPSVDVSAPALGLSEQAIRAQTEALKEAAASLRPYRAAIREASAANNGSINSLNNLRDALVKMRNEVAPTSADFDRLTKRIKAVDAESEKLTRRERGRRRLSGGQVAQAAGAAISGGIFGGPEGFIGGVGGALVGGVGGAFTGAAIGAQLGGIRRQLGEFADYAAQIEKLKISLKGIAGPQQEYTRALAAAAGATENLNVPQDVAIKGITRLTAAVEGAGGGVADAELAFNSINSAIIATGGGAEQVEGAITALVQIFSKGKVSAEEINQIAERLPGTFNKIAEASGRTGPELTKALQDGVVGLGDLQKFLISLGDEYGDLAKEIADSSENAGARLQKAFDKLRLEVGKALQPIGAEFQAAFAEFIAEITPSLIKAAKAAGDSLKFILDNREIIGFAASLALKFAAVNIAIKAFAALNGPISATFTLLKTGFKSTSQQAVVAKNKLIGFGKTVRALALSLAAPIVITFVVIGAELVISYFNRIKKAREDLDKTFEAPRGVDYFKAIGGKAATRQKLLTEIGNITKASNILRERIEDNKEKLQDLQDVAAVTYSGGGGAVTVDPSGPSREDLKARIKADEAELDRLIDNFQELQKNLPKAKDEKNALAEFPLPVLDTDKDEGSRDAARKAEEIAGLQRQLAESSARKEILKIDEEIIAARLAIIDAQDQQKFEAKNFLQDLLNGLEFEKQKLEINNEYNAAVREIRETREGEAAALAEEIATQNAINNLEGAKLQFKEKQVSAQQDLNRLIKEQSKTFEEQFTDRQRQLGLISRDDFNEILVGREEQRLAGIQGLTPEQRERGLEQFRIQIDPSPIATITKAVSDLKDQLQELTNIGNIVANSANVIGDAFSQSFTDLITGSKSAKEALADFFKSVGSFFLDLAKQVIAKLIQIAILNAITGLLPGLSGGGGLGGGSGFLQGVNNPLNIANSSGFNLGGFFADGGRPPINRPSIVGERGPELFVPFQQGTIVSNEDLQEQMAKAGVSSMERSSSSRFRETREVMVPFTRSAEQLSVASAERETAQAISNPEPLDVRFESQVINNVEYVTADQYRKGMSQAAERGRALTLEALQNSVKARKRIGL